MIDISFLRPAKVGGMEFMDFQYTNFFDELSRAFDDVIVEGELKEIPDEVLGLVRKYTGFSNIEIHLVDAGNLAIEVGYLNPNNVFNIQDIEKYLPRSESTLYRWFTGNKQTFFKGTIDYQTGSVGGTYAELPFRLFVNSRLNSFLSKSFLDKHNVSYGQALAAVFIHELGHAFGAVMMIHQSVYDAITVRTAVDFFTRAKTPKDRVTVIKDAYRLLDPDTKSDQKIESEIANSEDSNEFVVFLTKVASQRNLKRSLSLGVTKMNSEVVADAYSVRMGCGRSLAVGIGSMTRSLHMSQVVFTLMLSLMSALNGATTSLIFGGIAGAVVLAVFSLLFYMGNNTPGGYNSEYRRMTDILTQMIGKLKDNKFISAQDKQRYLGQIIKTQKLIDDNKPFIEGSAFQSMWMWLNNGSDAKLINIEHYTSLIANSKTNVLSEQFNSLS
ncbi:hypothetical protein [Klebsiella phage phiKp_32]|nr:hypothetical protein [Klebsiella phage phiKp_32]